MVLSKAPYVIKKRTWHTVHSNRQKLLLLLSAEFTAHSTLTLSACWLSCVLPEVEQKLEFRFRV